MSDYSSTQRETHEVNREEVATAVAQLEFCRIFADFRSVKRKRQFVSKPLARVANIRVTDPDRKVVLLRMSIRLSRRPVGFQMFLCALKAAKLALFEKKPGLCTALLRRYCLTG